MPLTEYLHRQADTCLRLARTTFDLTTAEKLRYMAADLRAKAEQLDEADTLEPHTMSSGNSRTGSTGASDRN
jgi:hypothetical protein